MKTIYRLPFIALFIFQASFTCAQDQSADQAILQNLKELSAPEMQGRRTGTEGGKKARELILKWFFEMELPPFHGNYEQAFSFSDRGETYQAENLIGFIKGYEKPEEFIVVGAHYDHLGIANGKTYLGADDNASGTVALVEIARYFLENPPGHSLLIVAFDAEELGLQGAKQFMESDLLPKEKIKLMVNMDMLSISDKNELFATGSSHYPTLKPILQAVPLPSENIQLKFGHDTPADRGSDNWTYSSDHAPFHEAGIPFIYFGVEDHPHYHRATDSFENIHPAFYLQAVELVKQAIVALDQKL